MAIWRLIAHHENAIDAIEEMKRRNRIAIGWSDIGDLSRRKISSAPEIATLIAPMYPASRNAHLGGPSLWNLYATMSEGDLVILNAYGRRKCVLEVAGPYIFEEGEGEILGYAHQRPAFLTAIDPDELWRKARSKVADGQNVRWTLAACMASPETEAVIHTEGARYSITATIVERSAQARTACLEHYGYQCAVCGFDFERTYGELGRGYIHVHHKNELAFSTGPYVIDFVKDLIPLCPNCHAMAHKRSPAVPIDELERIYMASRNNA